MIVKKEKNQHSIISSNYMIMSRARRRLWLPQAHNPMLTVAIVSRKWDLYKTEYGAFQIL